MRTIRRFAARHPARAYFALTFAISWGGALAVVGGGDGMSGTAPTNDPRFLYALLAMLAGPSVSGILLTKLIDGREGFRRFLERLTEWRAGSRWYAVAILTAPLLMLATLFTLSLTSPAYLPGIFTSPDRRLLLAGLGVGISAGLFEELGWTGFAIPTLRRRYGPFATGLLVGVPWSAWHLLTNVAWAASAAAGNLPLWLYVAANLGGVLVGYLTAFRVLMVWVWEHTGSLPLAMLMHVSFTSSLLVLNPIGLAGAPLVIYSYTLAGALWIVVGAIASVDKSAASRRSLRQVA